MNKNTLFLECKTGISGDMVVAALIDLGADPKVLEQVLATIPTQGFQTRITRVKKAGLDVCDFDVILDEAFENHDHDMEYLYGHEHHHDQEQHHGHEQHHDHEHHHNHEHHHDHEHPHDHQHAQHHEHRGLKDVLAIIESTQMNPGAKELATRIFTILGEAEAKAHGTTLEEVHFHEVGAIDSIVDIISVAVCLDNLDIHEVIIPSIAEGCGTVRCAHGILPIPVPAVVNIVSAHNLSITQGTTHGELITPTGAAIAAAICTDNQLPATYQIKKIGMGAGKRAYDTPSIVRAMLIEEASDIPTDTIWKLETNVDDCTGEALGFVMEKLLEQGARDVHFFPVFMKKNRPGYQLNVICTKEQIPQLEQTIFENTTTIGIRRVCMERSILSRRQETVNTPFGPAKVKVCTLGDTLRYYPEYESVAAICREKNIPFQEAFLEVKKACEEQSV